MNQLINHQTARLAKKAGFNEKCRFVFNKDGSSEELSYSHGEEFTGKVNNEILSLVNGTADCVQPTQSVMMWWLRKQGIVISIYSNASGYLFDMAYNPGGSHLHD